METGKTDAREGVQSCAIIARQEMRDLRPALTIIAQMGRSDWLRDH